MYRMNTPLGNNPSILTRLSAQEAGICFHRLLLGWEILHHGRGVLKTSGGEAQGH